MRALGWLLFAGCGGGSSTPALDAGLDAGIDAAIDAASGEDAGDDAGVGVCGGRDHLEVVTTHVDGTPDIGVNLYLRCGALELFGDTGVDGHFVFDGLDLAHQPVDVTAWDYAAGLPVETYLDVDDTAGGRVEIVMDGGDSSGARPLHGNVERSEPGSVVMIWMPWSFAVTDVPTFTLIPYDLDPMRLTAIEYRLEDDGIVPLAFFDRTFASPPFEELPTVSFVAGGAFETAHVELVYEDERLFDRWLPGSQDPLELRAPVLVSDRTPGDWSSFHRAVNTIGLSTRLDASEGADQVDVAWWPEMQGQPLTQLQAADATFRVWTVARFGVTPDAIGSVVMPSPPRLSGITPNERTDLDGLEVTVERPDWLPEDGELVVAVMGNFGYGPEERWRVHPGRGRDAVRFSTVEGLGTADMVGAQWLGMPEDVRLVVFARNGVDPNDGVNRYAEDGRFPVDVHF